jgi:hypothetical protein
MENVPQKQANTEIANFDMEAMNKRTGQTERNGHNYLEATPTVHCLTCEPL